MVTFELAGTVYTLSDDEATLLLSPQAAESLIRWCVAKPASNAVPQDAPPRWTAMQVDFESEEQALFLTLGLGARVRVMGPPLLRDRVAAELRAISDAAGQS